MACYRYPLKTLWASQPGNCHSSTEEYQLNFCIKRNLLAPNLTFPGIWKRSFRTPGWRDICFLSRQEQMVCTFLEVYFTTQFGKFAIITTGRISWECLCVEGGRKTQYTIQISVLIKAEIVWPLCSDWTVLCGAKQKSRVLRIIMMT